MTGKTLTEHDLDKFKSRTYTAALEAHDRGWNIMPLSLTSKTPLLGWMDWQTNPVTDDMIDDWFTEGVRTKSGNIVKYFNIGLITGELSGVVAVDCDNEDAIKFAEKNAMTTPYKVITKKGAHFYFKHPRQGTRFANKVGGVGRDWPQVEGLDFRGDGGFVVMPPSIKVKDEIVEHEYTFETTADWEDLDLHPWKGVATEAGDEFSFGSLDLSGVGLHNPEEFVSIWDQTKVRVAHLGRKLQDGDGTDALMVRYVGQKVRQGIIGDDCLKAALDFNDEFLNSAGYDPDQTKRWIETKVRSAIEMDRRNYPSDYDSDGHRIVQEKKPLRLGRLKPILGSDIDRLIDSIGETEYWADPIIPNATITQVVGYNGHGKSFFLQALLTSMAAGKEQFGPYETKPAKILYLDYDNPSRTILYRFKNFVKMFGETSDKFNMWSPSLINAEDGGEMVLSTEEGFRLLGEWLEAIKPDIVVIDTVRNAFGGLEEASASEWFKVNHVAKSIRNKFGASVVMVHHRNKPGENGLGREAGSTAQLTDIDTQVMVTQVFQRKADAKAKAGLWDGDLEMYDGNGKLWTPFGFLEQRLRPDSRLRMVSQISFGKVRQTTELQETHFIGWAESLIDGSQYVVSTASMKQKAAYYAGQGMSVEDISRKLSLPVYEVGRWV